MTAWLFLGAAVAVMVPALLFYLLQHRIVFSPRYYPRRSIFLEFAARYKVEQIRMSDGTLLEGMRYEPEEGAIATVLYFGGREQDSVALIGKLSFHYPQVRFISYNYRGYGTSEGKPGHATLYPDALEVYDAVHERFGDVGVLGYSLGTSAAARVGAKRMPRWVAMVSPFTSVQRLFKERLKVVPSFLVRGKFDTLASVAEMVCPLFLYASRDDEVVPLSHFQTLKAAARNLGEAKEFSGYNHASLLFSEPVEEELAKVFRR